MAEIDCLSTPSIRVEIRDSVGWLLIDNPARHNALTFAMWQAIPQAVAALDADDSVRLIAVSGAAGASFASGADISEFDIVRSDEAVSIAYEAANADAFSALRKAAKPTVAVIRRFCMGGGIGLAAACDLRFASDDSVFSIPAARLALAYPVDAVADIVHLIGPSPTRDLFYTARRLDAAEAHRLGLIDRLIPLEGFEASIAASIAEITALAPLTQRAVKSAVRLALEPDARNLREQALRDAARCFSSDDYKEGRAAFREKRQPTFTSR
ncbi:enoyl-CoA hydratase [Oryzibacter oryziterrae]|uniref:enoyl-CoA hydratase n=1 Tax=Oryzibacter oryziterrae TaxID=2766474 RepID=UPI001F01DF33|nr:enoyl-CoA hydratase [Oryzibacter oryziterrae]